MRGLAHAVVTVLQSAPTAEEMQVAFSRSDRCFISEGCRLRQPENQPYLNDHEVKRISNPIAPRPEPRYDYLAAQRLRAALADAQLQDYLRV